MVWPSSPLKKHVACRVGHDPGAVGIRVDPHALHVLVVARVPDDGARGGVAERDPVGEDLLHPLVRIELLALLDPDGGEETAGLGVKHLERLVLDDLVEVVVELAVVRVDGVECLPGSAHPLHLRLIGELRERIDLDVVRHEGGRGLDVPVLHRRAQEDPDAVGLRTVDGEAIGNRAVISGREIEILPCGREVVDETEPGVVGGTEETVRHLHHGRTIALQVEVGNGINGRAVTGQKEGLGAHKLVKNHDLIGLYRADGVSSVDEGLERCAWHALEEGVHGPGRVEVVVDLLGGLR